MCSEDSMRMLEDRRDFFDELERCYAKEGRGLPWTWESLEGKDMDPILFYLAFSLSKNMLHGPLPDQLHNRMVLSDNEWCRAYLRYLGS